MKHYVTVYDRFRVKAAIVSLASRVTEIIEEHGAENCILLTVLEGGSFLANKIIDRLPQGMLTSLETASVKVSSYHGDLQGDLTYDYLPNVDCKGKTVILIDDFCDSGSTTNNLYKIFINRYDAGEVIFVTLLARKRRKLYSCVKLLYGIEDNTENFYFGCGMDEDGKGRYMNEIVTAFEKENIYDK